MTHTYSIAAVDPVQGWVGAAAASCTLAVGAGICRVRRGVGVVNSQHWGNPRMAENVLDLADGGMKLGDALHRVLEGDTERDARQFCAVLTTGETAVWTGRKCARPHLHKPGMHCAAAGNRLASPTVISRMVDVFETSPESPFAERLLLALEAGRAEGGDALGHESATLLAIPRRIRETWPINQVDLRVDHHPHPVAELRRIYDLFEERNRGYADA